MTAGEIVVAAMAREIHDGAVVATGVASPLAILAIAAARATHAPNLTYLACIGALDPEIRTLERSSEALAYLEGRKAEITIPDLFDHARRGRIDVVFFGAAEVDAEGRTNMSASGSLEEPRAKFPGVAGASTLRRLVRRPVLVVPKQNRRNLVGAVQVATTSDPERRSRLLTDLGAFDLGSSGALLLSRHAHASFEDITDRTGFAFEVRRPLSTTAPPSDEMLCAIRRIDAHNLRDQLVG